MKASAKILFLASFTALFTFAASKLVDYPKNTTVFIGGNVRFTCSTNNSGVNWDHRYVGFSKSTDVFMSKLGLRDWYATSGRHSVDDHQATGRYNLAITSVHLSDAGTYFCIDESGMGERAAAELIVLDSSPICKSNISTEGALGDNSCNLEPDNIGFFCSVHFQGNTAPTLQWKNTRTGDIIETGATDMNITTNIATSTLVLKTEMNINESNFVCEVKDVPSNNYSRCSTHNYNFLYLFDSFKTLHVTKSDGKVICSANTSQSCNYKWVSGGSMINGSVLDLSDPTVTNVNFYCLAECFIRGRVCSTKPVFIQWLLDVDEMSLKVKYAVGLTIALQSLLTVLLATVIILVILKRPRIKAKANIFLNNMRRCCNKKEADNAECQPLLEVVADKNTETKNIEGIIGLTCLSNKIFVLCYNSDTILVFSDENGSQEQYEKFDIRGMTSPKDMVACGETLSIFISDDKCLWKIQMPEKQISKWQMDDSIFNLSTTSSGTLLVIVKKEDRPKKADGESDKQIDKLTAIVNYRWVINMYTSSNVNLVESTIFPKNVLEPIHAVLSPNGSIFIIYIENVVTESGFRKEFYRLSEISVEGIIINTYDPYLQESVGFDWWPMYLAIDRENNIYVADHLYQRVIILNSQLDRASTYLKDKNQQGARWPRRLCCLPEENKLIVGGWSEENSCAKFSIYNLKNKEKEKLEPISSHSIRNLL